MPKRRRRVETSASSASFVACQRCPAPTQGRRPSASRRAGSAAERLRVSPAASAQNAALGVCRSHTRPRVKRVSRALSRRETQCQHAELGRVCWLS
eukprot:2756690-Pleurochrysis_carterae.AAC.1